MLALSTYLVKPARALFVDGIFRLFINFREKVPRWPSATTTLSGLVTWLVLMDLTSHLEARIFTHFMLDCFDHLSGIGILHCQSATTQHVSGQ